MRDVDAHSNLAGVNPAAARSFKMRNTGTTLRLGVITLLAATGLAGGCSYDQNPEWSTTPAEAKPLAKAQRQNSNRSDDTYQVTMMDEQQTIWDGLFEQPETEDYAADGEFGTGNPIDIFGSINGRAMTQGNPNAPAAKAIDINRPRCQARMPSCQGQVTSAV